MNICKICKEYFRDDLDFCPNCKEQNFSCIECGKIPCKCDLKNGKKKSK